MTVVTFLRIYLQARGSTEREASSPVLRMVVSSQPLLSWTGTGGGTLLGGHCSLGLALVEELSLGDLFQELLKHTLFGLDLRATGMFALTGVNASSGVHSFTRLA